MINQEDSLFAEANKNTKQILEKIIVYKDNMVDELNFIAKQAVMSAKMELAMAEVEGVPLEECSALAQRVAHNPDFQFNEQFKLVDLVALAEDSEKSENSQLVHEKGCSLKIENEANCEDRPLVINADEKAMKGATLVLRDGDNATECDGLSLYMEEDMGLNNQNAQKKCSHSQARRTWLALQNIKTDECELKIEVARLTQNDQKKLEKERTKLVVQTNKDYDVLNECDIYIEGVGLSQNSKTKNKNKKNRVSGYSAKLNNDYEMER